MTNTLYSVDIHHTIGQGAFGVVYLITDQHFHDTQKAVKVSIQNFIVKQSWYFIWRVNLWFLIFPNSYDTYDVI